MENKTNLYYDEVWRRDYVGRYGDGISRKTLTHFFNIWKSGKCDDFAKKNGGLMSNGIRVIQLNTDECNSLYPKTKLFFNDKFYTLMCLKNG